MCHYNVIPGLRDNCQIWSSLSLLFDWKQSNSKFQGFSRTQCTFHRLSRPWILIFNFKDFQGLSRCVRTLNMDFKHVNIFQHHICLLYRHASRVNLSNEEIHDRFGREISETLRKNNINVSYKQHLIHILWKRNCYLRNRKHVPCFYQVIETQVEVWENEKCCGNRSRRWVFSQLFRVLQNF